MYFFFFNDTATTEIYTLSLHDALPISWCCVDRAIRSPAIGMSRRRAQHSPAAGRCAWFSTVHERCGDPLSDRKSTRLNSSHANISYAVFCLKKKKTINYTTYHNTATIP